MGDRLPRIYRSLGENYRDRVLPSIIPETLKAVVAEYNARQLIAHREVSIPKFLVNWNIFEKIPIMYFFLFSFFSFWF